MKFKEGQEVYLKFYDHVQDHDEEITCEVWGRVLHENRVSVTIATWDLCNTDPDTRQHNQSRFSIVKGAIINWRVIK